MIVDKRVVGVLLLGICMWYICGARVFGSRELVDICVMAELISRTFKNKR
jgi:hypothetical protein